MEKYALVGDVGGTNENLAIVELLSLTIKEKIRLNTQETKNFSDSVMKVLAEHTYGIEMAAFAIAGPVHGKKVRLTNADLIIDADDLEKKTGIKHVHLMNDFTAISHGVSVLDEKDMIVVNEGMHTKGTKVVLGAGTGLGMSIIAEHSNGPLVVPSEGGHAAFASLDETDVRLKEYLDEHPVEWEHVLSGNGIERMYKFLGGDNLSAAKIGERKDEDEKAGQAFGMFFRYLARCAQGLALTGFATGGVYLGGGIITRHTDFDRKGFVEEFTKHGRFMTVLEKMPVYAITTYDVSILGLAHYLQMWKV